MPPVHPDAAHTSATAHGPSPLRQRKARCRRRGRAARERQPDKDGASHIIAAALAALPEYAAAKTLMCYVDTRSEVRTRGCIEAALAAGKRVAVPYCDGDALGLWRLEGLSELAPGTWGILEPPRHRWPEPGRRVAAGELDLVVVPGVAFDRAGGRAGNGKGYYDRFLRGVRADALCVGLCYERQLVAEVPMGAHDARMDRVLTEGGVYRGGGGRAARAPR